nr:MAG TPA: hypothetical protein [Caudoviricetes sp.]
MSCVFWGRHGRVREEWLQNKKKTRRSRRGMGHT